MIKADISKYRVNEVKKLSERPTYEDFGKSENKLENELIKTRCILGEFQDVLYAHGKYSVLICLQGMDSAGKDSLIREVFKDFNISGVEVTSFKVPTDLELKHNYL
ncbi:MAG: polyphosphate kinase 2 family protein, partial [Flavobacteriales bacterium]